MSLGGTIGTLLKRHFNVGLNVLESLPRFNDALDVQISFYELIHAEFDVLES